MELVNNGSIAADNTEVEILDTYPFTVNPDEKREYSFGEVKTWEQYHFNTEVTVADDVTEGEHDIELRITSGDITKTVSVPVRVQNQAVDLTVTNIQTDPATLLPDTENNELTLDVVNNGDRTAEHVVATTELPDGFEPVNAFAQRQAVGNIAPGETKQATFRFDINTSADAGMVTMPATIQYAKNDSSARETQDVSFDLHLTGAPRYELTGIESDLAAGERGTIRATVQNTGSEKSTSTRLRVLDSADLPFSYDSSNVFIGTLQPGQNGTAVFDVTVEEDAHAKDYLIDFEVRGVKNTDVFVDEFTKRVTAGATGQTGTGMSSAMMAGLAGILVVLAVGGYLLWQRRPLHDRGDAQ
jgi:hypothetical protein